MRKLVPWTPEEEAVIWDEMQKNWPAKLDALREAAKRLTGKRTYRSVSRHFYFCMKPAVEKLIGDGASPPALLLAKLLAEQEKKVSALESEIGELKTRSGEEINAELKAENVRLKAELADIKKKYYFADTQAYDEYREKLVEAIDAVCDLVSCVNAYRRASKKVIEQLARRRHVAI